MDAALNGMQRTFGDANFKKHTQQLLKQRPNFYEEVQCETRGGSTAEQLEIRAANAARPKSEQVCELCANLLSLFEDPDGHAMVCGHCGFAGTGSLKPSLDAEKFCGPSADGSDAKKNLERARTEVNTAEEDHDLATIKDCWRAQNRLNQIIVWLKAMRIAPPDVLQVSPAMERAIIHHARRASLEWARVLHADDPSGGMSIEEANEVEALRQLDDRSGSPIFWFIQLVRLVWSQHTGVGFVAASEEIASMLDMDGLHAYLSQHKHLTVATHEYLGNATRAGGDGAAGARQIGKPKMRTVRIDSLGSDWDRFMKSKYLDQLLQMAGVVHKSRESRGYGMPVRIVECKPPEVRGALMPRAAISVQHHLCKVQPVATGLQLRPGQGRQAVGTAQKREAERVTLRAAAAGEEEGGAEEGGEEEGGEESDESDAAVAKEPSEAPAAADDEGREVKRRKRREERREADAADGAAAAQRKRKREEREEREAQPDFDSEEEPDSDADDSSELDSDQESALDESDAAEVSEPVALGAAESGQQQLVIEDEDVEQSVDGKLSVAVSGPETAVLSVKEMDEYCAAGRAIPADTLRYYEAKQREAKKARQARPKIPNHKIRTATDAEIRASNNPAANFMRRHAAIRDNRYADAAKRARREARDAKRKLEEARRHEAQQLRQDTKELQEELEKGAERERKMVSGGEVIVKNADGTLTVERYAPKIHLGGAKGKKAMAIVEREEAKANAKPTPTPTPKPKPNSARPCAKRDEEPGLRVTCYVCRLTRRYALEDRKWHLDSQFCCASLMDGRKCGETDAAFFAKRAKKMKAEARRVAAAAAAAAAAAGPSAC